MDIRTSLLAGGALLAFAGNSILCRGALAGAHADPATFTLVRLASGAAVLAAVARARGRAPPPSRASFARAVALFAYAALFSWAYVRVPAGPGALVLFAAVQLTMLAAATRAGVGPRGAQWAGLALALGGLATLTLPGATAPDPWGLVAMAGAGAAWGAYSLRGRDAGDPTSATARAFLGALPLAVVVAALGWQAGTLRCDATGLVLALASGAVFSGLGYVVWYAVLPRLPTTTAAIVQLAVPILAAVAATLLLGETPTLRLAVAGAAVLAGIALATRRQAPPPRPS